jgi:AraC-like DNA-binding protein
MLEEGRHTVETVAYETGFGDRERMHRAFYAISGFRRRQSVTPPSSRPLLGSYSRSEPPDRGRITPSKSASGKSRFRIVSG